MRVNQQLRHVRVRTLSDDITRDRHVMSCHVMSCHVMSCQYCTIQCTTTPYNATRHNNISLNEIKSHAPMHVTCVQMAGCMQRMVIWPTQKLWDAVDASLSSAYSIISHRIISHRLHCILSTIKIYDSIIVAHSIVF